MKVRIVDAAALGALRPLDMLAYLRSRGWKPLETEAGAPLSEWSKAVPSGYFEVQVPRHPTWRDYALRVQAVVATLADEERRSQLELLQDIAQVSCDVRVAPADD